MLAYVQSANMSTVHIIDTPGQPDRTDRTLTAITQYQMQVETTEIVSCILSRLHSCSSLCFTGSSSRRITDSDPPASGDVALRPAEYRWGEWCAAANRRERKGGRASTQAATGTPAAV